MITKYTIHKIGTPVFAWKKHWTERECEYWNNDTGWTSKKNATVFDTNEWNLPDGGEWIEIYVNEDR